MIYEVAKARIAITFARTCGKGFEQIPALSITIIYVTHYLCYNTNNTSNQVTFENAIIFISKTFMTW